MKKVELVELTLTNYRNIEYDTLHFEGSSAIVGDNRIGKTNTLEAIMWLLTDKLLNGGTDISQIKPLSDTSKEVVVKGTFLVDGKPVSLKKSFKEKWTKTRGSTDLIMQGHTTSYYFNDVKQSTIKEYNANIYETFGIKFDSKAKIECERMLVDPFYLGELGESTSWTALRTFIIELVGDVDDNDVFNANPKFQSIKSLVERHNGKIDQAKKGLTQDINTLKDQILGDDAVINNVEQTKCPTDEEIAIAKKGVEECETNISILRQNKGTDTASALIEKQIVETKQLVNEEYARLLKEQTSNSKNVERERLNASLNKLIDSKTIAMDELSQLETSKSRYELGVKDCVEKRLKLKNQVIEIDEKIKSIESNIESVCPLCGRPYDKETMDAHIKEAVEKLNAERQEIVEKGKANNELKASFEKHIDDVNYDITQKNQRIETIANQINECKDKLSAIPETEIGEITSPKYVELTNKVNELQEQLTKSRQDFATGSQENALKIIEEQEKLKPFKDVLADKEFYDRQLAHLDEVKSIREKHSLELVDKEQDKELLNEFIRTKLNMLNDNVASVFGDKIKFQLIKENINGGYDLVCKPYIYGTDTLWKSGSKSERVITGVAIAEAIKTKLDLPNLPFLFDEGGEISTDTFKTKFTTDSQLICVKVKDNIPRPMVITIG